MLFWGMVPKILFFGDMEMVPENVFFCAGQKSTHATVREIFGRRAAGLWVGRGREASNFFRFRAGNASGATEGPRDPEPK